LSQLKGEGIEDSANLPRFRSRFARLP